MTGRATTAPGPVRALLHKAVPDGRAAEAALHSAGGKMFLAERIAALLPPPSATWSPSRITGGAAGQAGALAWRRSDDLDGDSVHVLAGAARASRGSRARLRPDSASLAVRRQGIVVAPTERCLERARRVWVRLTQGRGGHACGARAGATTRTRLAQARMPGYLDRLCGPHRAGSGRLIDVSLECNPALDLIRDYGRHRERADRTSIRLTCAPPARRAQLLPRDARARRPPGPRRGPRPP